MSIGSALQNQPEKRNSGLSSQEFVQDCHLTAFWCLLDGGSGRDGSLLIDLIIFFIFRHRTVFMSRGIRPGCFPFGMRWGSTGVWKGPALVQFRPASGAEVCRMRQLLPAVVAELG